MKILKFGGSSVKTTERIEQVVQLISSAHPCAVVVSAFGGVTDQLIQLTACAERGTDCNNELQLLINIKNNIIEEKNNLIEEKNNFIGELRKRIQHK